jgi:hypothetical protein
VKALALLVFLPVLGSALAAEAPPKFTSKPTAAKVGGEVKISFAVDRETDVTIGILDAKGKVVRHLVSGRLGANAPAPLRAGLSQSLEWDGKADDGKPAAGGPFRARVGLGLRPELEEYMFNEPGRVESRRTVGVDSGTPSRPTAGSTRSGTTPTRSGCTPGSRHGVTRWWSRRRGKCSSWCSSATGCDSAL